MFLISYEFHNDSRYCAGKKETNHDGSPVLRKKVEHVQILLFPIGIIQDNFFESFFVNVVASLYFLKKNI